MMMQSFLAVVFSVHWMTMSNHLGACHPAQAPVSFDPPALLECRRVTGFVQTALEDEQNTTKAPSLERHSSISGNILLMKCEEGRKAYLLQRKVENTVNGSIRVGYVLRDRNDSDDGPWEVATTEFDRHEMVSVTIEDLHKVFNDDRSNNVQSPWTELSVLQTIAQTDPEGRGHVIGTSLIGSDRQHVYTILPFHREGSLLDYCAQVGRLNESEARFFFGRILKGLETLQQAELCHRSLSLEAVLIWGTECSLAHLGCALRVPTSTGGMVHLIEPQPACGSNSQYMAPELLKGEPFDGYAVDLWAAGVMLFVMLMGTDLLFAAPVPEDRRFREICMKGRLKEVLTRWQAKHTHTELVSDATVDLLQKMLRAEPRDRFSLLQVREHEWVVAEGETIGVPSRLSSKLRMSLPNYSGG